MAEPARLQSILGVFMVELLYTVTIKRQSIQPGSRYKGLTTDISAG